MSRFTGQSDPLLSARIQALPFELQREIYLESLQVCAYSINDLKQLVFETTRIGHLLRSFPFGVAIRHIIRRFYGHMLETFPRHYVLEMLFPDGTSLGTFDGIAGIPPPSRLRFVNGDYEMDEADFRIHIPDAPRGDSHMRVCVNNRSRVHLLPTLTNSEPMKDYWWLAYLCQMKEEVCLMTFQLSKISDKSNSSNSLVDNNIIDNLGFGLYPLLRFLTVSYGRKSSELLQSQYDYLGSLTIAQRNELKSALDDLVGIIVCGTLHQYPSQRSRFRAILPHRGDTRYDGGKQLTWTQYASCGAWFDHLRQEILGMRASELMEMLDCDEQHFFDGKRRVDGALRDHLDNLRCSFWFRVERPWSANRVSSRCWIHAENMLEFASINRLWAFEKALDLPQGQALDLAGPMPVFDGVPWGHAPPRLYNRLD